MTDASRGGFLLPHDYDAERLVERLGGAEHCAPGESSAFEVHFYDSFDWRLHQAGLHLSQVVSRQGRVLRLKNAHGVDVLGPVEFPERPAWPVDLPPGGLREQVAKALEMRVLLPLVTVSGEATELRVLNEDGKTVVRLQLLLLSCRSSQVTEWRSLLPRVRLLPVRGYEAALKGMAAFFAEEMEWPNAPPCLFEEALAAVGREAGDYSSKLDLSLRPEQMAIDAMRKIFRHLLDTLARNIDGTRADLDSEFLHDLRVATRRTRSALTQVKRVLPDPIVDEYKQRFAWLGQITGPTRDLDVFLLELPRYRASLPAAMASDLDALESHLHAAQAREQSRLKRRLASAQMRALLTDWQAVLDAESLSGEPGWFADLPIERVASQRIWQMYKKVRKAGRAVTGESPPSALHELRKDCKKLRYLIEFFRSLYPAKELKGLIKTLKTLLDNLGQFQDLEVQADKLREFAQAFEPDDPARLPTVMAIGALVADLLRHQQAAHDRFAACFAAFDAPENRARYTRLFKHKGKPKT